MQLSDSHSAGALAPSFAQKRRIQVRDFFAEPDAERIHGWLERETPWWIAFNVGERVEQLSPEALARLTPQESARMLAEIHARAQREYQFLYSYYPVFAHYFDPTKPWLPIFELYEALNSPPILDYLRRLTGRDDIVWMDCQATQFRPGHFLKFHNDENAADRRVAAYVLNFTKGWGRDWGGFLEFWDPKYDIEEALRPVFNALNIFLTPMEHSVGMVANYAPRGRTSVTGWLRADDPPGPFDRSRR